VQGINIDDLKEFIGLPVKLSIQDHSGEEQPAPFLKKEVKKITYCPDRTHVRIFFDERNFFAIPLTANVSISDKEWLAFDEENKLYYVLRKVD